MWSFLKEVCNAIIETKKRANVSFAVGTTSVRSVETAALSAEENGNPDLIEPFFLIRLFLFTRANHSVWWMH